MTSLYKNKFVPKLTSRLLSHFLLLCHVICLLCSWKNSALFSLFIHNVEGRRRTGSK